MWLTYNRFAFTDVVFVFVVLIKKNPCMQQGFYSLFLSFRSKEHSFYLLIFMHYKICIMLGCDNILSKTNADFKIL